MSEPGIERSVLSVPASSRRMMEKATSIPADAILFDLEDGVAAGEKERSRLAVIRAFRELAWGDRAVGYRINGLDTQFFYRDLIDVVEASGERVDFIVIPKVSRAADVQAIDILLAGIERARGLEVGKIRLEVIVERAEGLVRVAEIAQSTPRLQSLIFGPGDFSASMHMPSTGIGVTDEWDESYPGHRYHHAMSAIVAAARTAGLNAIDGPLADLQNPEALRRSSIIARGLGFDGKWCIHPAQVPVVNEVFSPTDDQLAWARRIADAYDAAAEAGVGAVTAEGRMIDAATVKLAQSVLTLARRAGKA
jgi:citrate lyase beta subunit